MIKKFPHDYTLHLSMQYNIGFEFPFLLDDGLSIVWQIKISHNNPEHTYKSHLQRYPSYVYDVWGLSNNTFLWTHLGRYSNVECTPQGPY